MLTNAVKSMLLLLIVFLPTDGYGLLSQRQQDAVLVTLRPQLVPDSTEMHAFIPAMRPPRPTVGLALSGGGARALAQIGALQVLEEHNIPVDFLVGTSMGSIIGGLYAAGYDSRELERIAKTIDWNSILDDRPPRTSLFFANKQDRDRFLLKIRFDGLKPWIPPALTPGQKLQSLLTRLTMAANYVSGQSFDDLRIPFRAVSTDLYSGTKVVLSNGDLAEAMRASLALPLLIAPVPWGDKLLVDGGLVDNIPVEEVRAFAADIVIAIDASSGLRDAGSLTTPLQIADQVTTIMQRERNAASRAQADLLVRIDVPGRSNTDFSDVDTLLKRGRTEMKRRLPDLLAKMEEMHAEAHRFSPDPVFAVHRIESELPDTQIVRFPELAGNGHERRLRASEWAHLLEALSTKTPYHDIYAEIRTSAGDGESQLHIYARQNPVLRGVRFQGNTVYPSDTLKQHFSALIGAPVHAGKTAGAFAALIGRYRQDGYALTRVAKVDFDRESGLGTVRISEGKIDSIQIVGAAKTRHYVILREFPLKPGDIFNYKRVRRGIDNIFATGLFDRASFSLERAHGSVILNLKLQEKKSYVLGLAPHTDSERRGRLQMEFANENLGGIGAKLRFLGLYGSRDLEFGTQLRLERIFKTYLTFDAGLSFSKRDHFLYRFGAPNPLGEYNENILGAHIGIGQLVQRLGVVTARVHSERYRVSRLSGAGFPVGTSVISRLVLSSTLDTRDRLPYPQSGRYVNFSYDVSGRLVNSRRNRALTFVRLFLEIETHSTLAGRHTFSPRFMLGTSDLTTPFEYQFRLGPKHMFGLRDQEWMGRHFVLANFSYRLLLPRVIPMRTFVGLRYDFGGIWESIEAVNYDEMHHAIGMTAGLETPLGTLAFSYGGLDTGRRRFYFSLGYERE